MSGLDEVAALVRQSIQDFEGNDWGDPPEDATYLIRTCMSLRRKPLGEFQPEDLRIMIGQRIGTDILVPMALGMLRDDPLVEGDCYPGDLLSAVLALPDAYWDTHPREVVRLREVIAELDRLGRNHPDYPDFSEEFENGLARVRSRLARD